MLRKKQGLCRNIFDIFTAWRRRRPQLFFLSSLLRWEDGGPITMFRGVYGLQVVQFVPILTIYDWSVAKRIFPLKRCFT